MKTKLTLLLLALAFSVRAQSLPYITASGGNAIFNGTFVANSSPVSSSTIFTNSSPWWIQFYLGYYVLETTNNSTPASEALALYSPGLSFPLSFTNGFSLGAYYSAPSGPPTFTFYNFISNAPPALLILSSNLTNFWPTNGGRVSYTLTGWNNSTAGSNTLFVLVNSNKVFTSTPTRGNYQPFKLSGYLDYDGTNLVANTTYSSGDPAAPLQFDLEIITNFVPTNDSFAIAVDPTGDTNLVPTAGTIQSAGYIPGAGQAFAALVPLPSSGGTNGANGANGTNGTNGANGLSIALTNITSIPYGSTPVATLVSSNGQYAFYSLSIPAGAPGPAGPPATNAVYPTPEFTLTNINPLLCTGSNFIGQFSMLYDYTLALPYTGVGMSPGTNLNESVYVSLTGTNGWILLTNSPVKIWTNVWVSVVGDNNTNYAGALTLFGLVNSAYCGATNDLTGQSLLLSPATQLNQPPTLAQMQTAIANAVGANWQFNGTHFQFAPNNQTNVDMGLGGSVGARLTAIQSLGTNWVLTATNVPAGYNVQVSTNLGLTLGWQNVTPSAVTTNLYATTNAWVFTIPKTAVNATYGFFRILFFQASSTTIWPPTTHQSVTLWGSNTWGAALGAITNAPDRTFGLASSNGVPVKWFWSNGVVLVYPWP